jgi:large subunit ribosomal protein L18
VADPLRKKAQRVKRQRRVSAKVRARAVDRVVLSVFRSARHIYATLAEPSGRTIFSVSTLSKEIREQKLSGNVASAKIVGKLAARKALEQGYKKVVFNRNGFLYHGRIRALADAAREAGLEF